MSIAIDAIKAAYLEEFNRSIPRLKQLAITLRALENDSIVPGDNNNFWNLTPDPKTNYELCQLAHDLSEMNEFWESHPDNNPTPGPTISVAIPESDRQKIEEYIAYFKMHFPRLKQLAKQAAKLDNCISDDELGAALDLLGDLAGPDLKDDCFQYFHDWADR